MRNRIILGTLLVLFGLAAVAEASDRPGSINLDAPRVHREASDSSRGDRHDRSAREEPSRERHDESHERNDRR